MSTADFWLGVLAVSLLLVVVDLALIFYRRALYRRRVRLYRDLGRTRREAETLARRDFE